jgi:hypothetical protein
LIDEFSLLQHQQPESVANAVLLNETTFRGRHLKITAKRTNLPGGGAPFRGGPGRGYVQLRLILCGVCFVLISSCFAVGLLCEVGLVVDLVLEDAVVDEERFILLIKTKR